MTASAAPCNDGNPSLARQPTWSQEIRAPGQIVDNLLKNAIMYTPSDGRVSLRLTSADGSAVVEVEDTGIGIPKLDRERIFERFFRVDKARSRDLGGTGGGWRSSST